MRGCNLSQIPTKADFYTLKILRLILCFSCIVFSLSPIAQTQKADSLKNVLPALKDSSRIDVLNLLGDSYIQQKGNSYNPWFAKIQEDSAKKYAQQALEEAKKIKYIKGMAKAYINLGRIEGFLLKDFSLIERYFTLGLEFSKQVNDDNQLAWAYGCLGGSKWIQSKFSEAVQCLHQAAELFKKLGDTFKLAESYDLISATESERGHYEQSLQYALKGLELIGKEDYDNLGSLYASVGDYETALNYFHKELSNSRDWITVIIGQTFFLQKKYDSAMHYYNVFSKFATTRGENELSKLDSHLGELYLALKQYDTALVYLNTALNTHRKTNDRNQIMRVLLLLSRTYREKENYKQSLQSARELLQIARETGARQYIRDAHFLLYSLFEGLQKKDSAYLHLRQYTIFKDSIDLDLSAQKLEFYKTQSEREKAQSKINLLNNEKKIQHQQLNQTAQQKRFLIAGIIALLLIAIVLFRNILLKRKNEKHRREIAENELQIQKLESEKTKTELQHQATELEMQALRAQMNPHFIFNSLNSINRFILQNNKAHASEYLTKFSRLVRLILQNSQAPLIPLESELESLQLYLELESVRFDHHFEFRIKVEEDLDTSSIKVPPLIIQPYTENAIWHGLMHKEDNGHLEVELFLEEAVLCCKITDDGIGRKKATELKSKSASTHKSMGMRITADRIAILQQKKQLDSYIKITDLVLPDGSAGGTEVMLKIPIIQ